MSMLKKDLIREAAAHSGQTETTVRSVVDAIEASVLAAVRGGQSVMLLGLGKLSVSHRGPKKARHMVTGAPVVVPARNVALLRPSDALNEAANQAPAAS
jgi:DNA-binding protein HU-beta